MKNLLSTVATTLLIGITSMTLSGSEDRGGNPGVRDQLIGAWRLASLDEPGPDGKIHKADSTGLLLFTCDGHVSVRVMERNPRAQAHAGPEQYSQGGYEASFGTYTIDESTHTFAFHVEGALVRALIGKNLLRSFEFSGKQLIVKSARPDEHWKVAWEHYYTTDAATAHLPHCATGEQCKDLRRSHGYMVERRTAQNCRSR